MTGPAPAPSRAGATVLASRAELDAARVRLDTLGWSWPRRSRVVTRAWWELAKANLVPYPFTRERTKSWDVWRAVHHAIATVRKEGRVLDVGAWQSEVLWALGRAGYTDLEGCDTDRRVQRMLGRDRIRYRTEDFFACAIEPGTLAALTCLSVIEHGVDAPAFLGRAAQLLEPGGRLMLTTDYWPTAIDTRGLTAFGRPWKIASHETAISWLDCAASLGLEPDGPVDLDARDAPISWNGRTYTFLWVALVKRRSPARPRGPHVSGGTAGSGGPSSMPGSATGL